jgi:hypothetical protein
MQRRHVVIGLVMAVASAVSFQLVYTEASPSTKLVSVTAPAMKMAVPAPTVALSGTHASDPLLDVFVSISDTTMMFATGVALLGIAAGVRRHTS